VPLPDVSNVCVAIDAETGLDLRLGVDLPTALADLKIQLPGGIKLGAKASDGIPNAGAIIADIMAQINTALGPFAPIFDLIDIALVIVKVFDAVKSLNPIKIADALVGLIKKVDIVAALVPPLSLPLMIRDFIDVLLVFLASLKAQLLVMLSAQVKLDAGFDAVADLQAAGDPDSLAIAAQLEAALNCGQANLDAMFAAQKNGAKPLNRLLALIGGLGEAVGVPALPSLELGGTLEGAVAPIDALIVVLGTVRAAIPV
jgi:hypothetical protein